MAWVYQKQKTSTDLHDAKCCGSLLKFFIQQTGFYEAVLSFGGHYGRNNLLLWFCLAIIAG